MSSHNKFKGSDLRAIRVHGNKTQEEMAKHVGISNNTYSNYERDVGEVKAGQLFAWMRFCNLNISSFFEQIDKCSEAIDDSTPKRVRK